MADPAVERHTPPRMRGELRQQSDRDRLFGSFLASVWVHALIALLFLVVPRLLALLAMVAGFSPTAAAVVADAARPIELVRLDPQVPAVPGAGGPTVVSAGSTVAAKPSPNAGSPTTASSVAAPPAAAAAALVAANSPVADVASAESAENPPPTPVPEPEEITPREAAKTTDRNNVGALETAEALAKALAAEGEDVEKPLASADEPAPVPKPEPVPIPEIPVDGQDVAHVDETAIKRHFVRVDEEEGAVAPVKSKLEGAFDRSAEVDVRTLISTRQWGQKPIVTAGDHASPDALSVREQTTGERAAQTGSRPVNGLDGELRPGGGPGLNGSGWDRGTLAHGGDGTAGGAAPTPRGALSGEIPTEGAGRAALAHERFSEAVDADDLLRHSGTDGAWRPTAVRIEFRDPQPKPVPTDSRGVAKVERRENGKDVGGTEAFVQSDTAPAPGPAIGEPQPLPGPQPDHGHTESVDDLRTALGWGPLDRSAIRPRAPSEGTEASAYAAFGSDQASVDIPLADVVFINAVGTPLGKYTEEIYEILQDRWYQLDLDVDAKAIGKQGEVAIVFRVYRTGKVEGLSVLRSSGNPALDRMALAAVPERLPRFPKGLTEPSVVQQVTFSYRNPMLFSRFP